jgi:hypothetical protein
MATVTIFSHKAQNPLTANDIHAMATVITTKLFVDIIITDPKSLNSK